MSREFFDVVTCQHEGSTNKFLFRAPAWSYLNKGDTVIVETKKGEQKATVVAVSTETYDYEDKTTKFIVDSMGATWPLNKVLAKVVLSEIHYKDEEENEEEVENDGQKEQTATG